MKVSSDKTIIEIDSDRLEVRKLREDTNRKANVTIPPRFAKALGWKPGQYLRIELDMNAKAIILKRLQ